MIGRNEFYNTETKETEYEYYWFDYNFIRHGGFTCCFEAFEALEKFVKEMENRYGGA